MTSFEDPSTSISTVTRPSLSTECTVPHSVAVSTSTATFSPRKEFANLSPLQKRRRTENLIAENDFETLAYALARKAENENQTDFVELVKHLIKKPEDAPMLRACLKSTKRTCHTDKALGISTSLKLSKWQYITLRQTMRDMGCDILPSYDALKQEKKECYVEKEDMVITETEVKLKLQSILDITVKRLLKTLETDLTGSNSTLISKWGFDGASGQSNYQQKIDGDDSSIFMWGYLWTLLNKGLAISCGEFVDVEKFRQYCAATARKYDELYEWYYMPSSVHKLLIHGADIIEHNNFIPIGKLSEEASEARNKDFKNFRTFHSRKSSRIATNEDIINNLLISSDPYLSSFRPKICQRNKPLTNEAKSLLLTYCEDKENIEFVDVGNVSDYDFD
ncbi:unnamed protein product [Chilo suppressalis]|uniref:Uncharacterized protein n=1 Tax=Chilo suppressalis TaxID=168631 RepID=A0ABN8B1Y8_CHISP|nr:unnamed protein product [Chilo suppressalis]